MFSIFERLLKPTDTPERAEFTALVAERGLRAALAWRDARYASVED